MNPYDFVHIDWTQGPERKEPQWHHRLTPTGTSELYAGRLEVQIKAERPLFSPAPGVSNSTKPIPFLHRGREPQITYIIPGSSLKGMLRSVAETLSNSCLSMFGETYSYRHIKERVYADYRSEIPDDFRKCQSHQLLCPACRIFGMMGRGQNAQVFLGKVNIGDAHSTTVSKHDSIYTLPLTSPKPHHRAFYLDPAQDRIGGRKYYFHHAHLEFPTKFIRFHPDDPPVNRHIQPLGERSCFEFTLDFVNLEADEFALLLLALVLEPGMRHKIGYGKPMGLGSIQLTPTKLTLIDYTKRYALNGSAESQKPLEGNKLTTYISTHTDPYKAAHLLDTTGAANVTLSDLRRIWAWPPREDITYQYPDKQWFDENHSARISDTP
jgi:hypothetical protein